MSSIRDAASYVLGASFVADIPVRVRTGLAKGALWTLMPFSSNWRWGGVECDVEAALRYLNPVKGAVFWDFGAHFGIHTVGVARQVGKAGQVVAFEPDPGAFKKLVRHVTMNRLENVITIDAAVSDSEGIANLYTPSRLGSCLSHLRFSATDEMGHTPFLHIKTVAPDDLVARNVIRPPNMIKIDIQGHGHKAVAGSINSIAAGLPIIAFSNHSATELAGSRSLLEPIGYTPFSFENCPISWDEASTEFLLLPPALAHRHD